MGVEAPIFGHPCGGRDPDLDKNQYLDSDLDSRLRGNDGRGFRCPYLVIPAEAGIRI